RCLVPPGVASSGIARGGGRLESLGEVPLRLQKSPFPRDDDRLSGKDVPLRGVVLAAGPSCPWRASAACIGDGPPVGGHHAELPVLRIVVGPPEDGQRLLWSEARR